MSDTSSLLEPLCHIAFEAAQMALDERAANLKRELKPDGSIVTSADTKVEQLLRKRLPKLLPGSNVYGEEFGHEPDEGNGVWLVDPVDGTSNFAFGSPLWGISIGLAVSNAIEIGVIVLPDLEEIYVGAKGFGAALNGDPLPPIPSAPFRPEELCSYNEHVLKFIPRAKMPGKMRCSGAFVVDGCFVATQRYRGLVGRNEKLYDVASSVLMGFELGAEVRYVDGSPFDVAHLLQDKKIEKPWFIFPADTGFVVPFEG